MGLDHINAFYQLIWYQNNQISLLKTPYDVSMTSFTLVSHLNCVALDRSAEGWLIAAVSLGVGSIILVCVIAVMVIYCFRQNVVPQVQPAPTPAPAPNPVPSLDTLDLVSTLYMR